MKKFISLILAASLLTTILFLPKLILAQTDTSALDVQQAPTDETFKELNPLVNFSDTDAGLTDASGRTNPGLVISRVLKFAFPLAGLILFVMLVWSGFEMLLSANGKKSLDAGKQRATNAIIGFFLLFASYWNIQVVEKAFGIKIL